jgi:hypothetical protein
MGLCASEDGSRINRQALGLDDDGQCDSATFADAAVQARNYAEDALCVLEQYPAYALLCLVNYDYAYRNILEQPENSKSFPDRHPVPTRLRTPRGRDTANLLIHETWKDVRLLVEVRMVSSFANITMPVSYSCGRGRLFAYGTDENMSSILINGVGEVLNRGKHFLDEPP